MSSHHWKGSKGKKGPRKGGHRKAAKMDSLVDQPVADSVLNVPCAICGHPVDPKRMHFHMVRFHGATMRSKGTPD